MRHARLVAMAALAVAAPSLGAQAPGGACGYDACALRREGVFFSQRVVAGVGGRVVARQGFAGFRLDSALAASPRALAEARLHRREARTGGLLMLAGTAAGVFAVVQASRDGWDDVRPEASAALAAGAVLQLVGGWRLQIADRALNRALWWYNRDLPR